MGTSANSLPTVNPVVMRDGPTLNRAQQLHLVEPVLRQEVRDALREIRDNKALGCDGFNALFFKQSGHIVGEDITDAVLEFFNSGRMYKAINCTTVTLVPKTARPSRITEYRPISCCTLLYKIIAKILTNRL